MLRPLRFIPPAQPIERARPPKGLDWLHEVKWDGYRCQLSKLGDRVVVYSRNGKEFTGRFSGIWEALRDLPAKSAIIDAEIVACREDGAPDFRALHSGNYNDGVLCAWCFDLMELNGIDLTQLPLMARKMDRWLKGYVETLTIEALEPGPGSDVVLARLSAALITRVLRHGMENMQETGWLKGLSDPGVARALAAIHDACKENWSVESLARKAGQSRAAFADRFHTLVGEPPMQYLFRRRMREASKLLRNGQASLAQIAQAVGYRSEAAFSTAFKRYSGSSPGEYRLGIERENI